jgi:hypothetical protein
LIEVGHLWDKDEWNKVADLLSTLGGGKPPFLTCELFNLEWLKSSLKDFSTREVFKLEWLE